ncbi:hypothetical protein VIGAN_04261400, partial [Vigna angularis var. angularis]
MFEPRVTVKRRNRHCRNYKVDERGIGGYRSSFKVYPIYVKERIKLFTLVMNLDNLYIEIVKVLFLWKIYKRHVYLMYELESSCSRIL